MSAIARRQNQGGGEIGQLAGVAGGIIGGVYGGPAGASTGYGIGSTAGNLIESANYKSSPDVGDAMSLASLYSSMGNNNIKPGASQAQGGWAGNDSMNRRQIKQPQNNSGMGGLA